jgi:hypothetical protein
MKIKLTFFKPSGKYYTDANIEYIGEPFALKDEIKKLRDENRLPGVVNPRNFHIVVTGECVPELIPHDV